MEETFQKLFVPRRSARGMATRVKNLVDTRFFAPELCAAGRPKAPLIASEKPVPGFLLALPLLRAAWQEELEGRRSGWTKAGPCGFLCKAMSLLQAVLAPHGPVFYHLNNRHINSFFSRVRRTVTRALTGGNLLNYNTLNELKIVVLCGGLSTERNISFLTGSRVCGALRAKGHRAVLADLYMGFDDEEDEAKGFDPEALFGNLPEIPQYSFDGQAPDLKAVRKSRKWKSPSLFGKHVLELCAAADIVFIALHGKNGEDGRVQAVFDMLGIPYTGSGVLAAAVTMDKAASKRVFISEGISTPKCHTYNSFEQKRDLAGEILAEFGLPVVVKAASQGSSIGVYIVEKEEELAGAIKEAFSYNDEVLVEEFIKGREMTVAVWGDEDKKEAFPIIEITTTSGRYDYNSKYTKGASTHIIPAPISEEKTRELQELAIKTYTACGCKGVARVDMMYSEDETPYVIEVNSVPGMTEVSLVPDAARAMGVEFPELCERILQLAGF